MTNLSSKTLGEAEAWREGYDAATREWFFAVSRGVYRASWGKHKGRWHSGIQGDALVYPELETLLEKASAKIGDDYG